jgi:uncharacterized protein YyaL (SSP411 family)
MYDRATGVLLRRYRDGDAAIHGFLDDYAFLAGALLDLYETNFNPSNMETALELVAKMRELFEDREHGAFFTTSGGVEDLVLRMKDDYDGAEPSGNAIAALDLERLAHITDRAELREAAERTLSALWPTISNQPVAVPQMLVAADYFLADRREVVIASDSRPDSGDDPTREFLRRVRSRFLPYTIVLLVDSGETRRQLLPIFPAIADMHAIDGKPTAYVCVSYACKLPTNDSVKFDELLQ